MQPDTTDGPASLESSASKADLAPGGSSKLPGLPALKVSLPKLAYVYDYAFSAASNQIGTLQRRHADLCEQQGPESCQILGMTKSGEESDRVTGELQMAVASRQARAFGALLEKEANSAGANELSAEIKTEELSKQIVDTEAQLRARTELRDRLMEVLRTHKGKVSELIEAERNVAQVNEEIDQARSWLAETQGRIAFSRVNVRYESGAPVTNDFLRPVAGALGSLGSIFGTLVAILILLGAVIVPIGGLVWTARAIGRRTNREDAAA